MLSLDDVRRLAQTLPETEEADHHGMPSFRVRGKIFCTLRAATPRAMVKLDPEDQTNLVAGHPGVVEPVPGYWGRKGSTMVAYDEAGEALMTTLLQLAWRRVAPKRLMGV